MTIAVERVGDQVQRLQGDERVERARGDTADPVRVQGQGLEVDEAVEQLLVDVGDLVFGEDTETKRGECYKHFFMTQCLFTFRGCWWRPRRRPPQWRLFGFG